MEYYDENGNLLNKEDLHYQNSMQWSQSESEGETLIDFHNIEHIYEYLIEDEPKLSDEVVKQINDVFYGSKAPYEQRLKLWNDHKQNPFFSYKFLVTHNERSYNARVDIFPDSNYTLQYIRYTALWVYKKLKFKRNKFQTYNLEQYRADYELLFGNLEKIESEIKRVENNIDSVISNYSLNKRLKDYSLFFESRTIDINYFNLKNSSRIENVWSIAIGIGLLYGSYSYLKFLYSKKREFTVVSRYRLKESNSYLSGYSDIDLEKIYHALVKEEFIEAMNVTDFINIFRETKFKNVKSIVWKKVNKRWFGYANKISS